MASSLLTIEDLHVTYPARAGWLRRGKGGVRAVNGVSLEIRSGETLGVVGESGCGKSTLAQAIVGLAPVTGGAILIEGRRYAADVAADRRALSRLAQIVFQDPLSSLDPRLRVWRLVSEPLRAHGVRNRAELRAAAASLIERVGLSVSALDRFPHEFSGGQRQRLSIARALALRPRLLILDEPTSALDVSVQAQILNLLLDLQKNEGLAYLFISHDIGVIRHIADRVAVMHGGNIVEDGTAKDVLEQPRHPYTQGLIAARPSIFSRSRSIKALRRRTP